jgi:large subunit ribosomal protein L10Ae
LQRNFRETVELQVMLKNYDPARDKRFSGTMRLPSQARPALSVCVLGDQSHIDEAKANDIPCMDVEALKKLKKNKKLVKKLGAYGVARGAGAQPEQGKKAGFL